MPTFPLRTARLLLRPLTADDLADLLAFESDPQVARYIVWDARDEAAMRRALAEKAGETRLSEPGDELSLGVVVPPDPTVIGEVGIGWEPGPRRVGELGYLFHPGRQGHGYAREAAREVLRVAFEEAGLHRVVARCDTRNEPSWRLMERLGMRREAHFVRSELIGGEWADEYLYAMLATEWRR